MQQYRVQEAIVEAVQLTESNTKEVAEWCKGKYISNKLDGGRVYKRMRNSDHGTFVFPDEWIIKHSDGFTKESDAKFRQTYGPVSAPSGDDILEQQVDEICNPFLVKCLSYLLSRAFPHIESLNEDNIHDPSVGLRRDEGLADLFYEIKGFIEKGIIPEPPLQSEGGLQWVKPVDADTIPPLNGHPVLTELFDGIYQEIERKGHRSEEEWWKLNVRRWLCQPIIYPSTANTEEGAAIAEKFHNWKRGRFCENVVGGKFCRCSKPNPDEKEWFTFRQVYELFLTETKQQ